HAARGHRRQGGLVARPEHMLALRFRDAHARRNLGKLCVPAASHASATARPIVNSAGVTSMTFVTNRTPGASSNVTTLTLYGTRSCRLGRYTWCTQVKL